MPLTAAQIIISKCFNISFSETDIHLTQGISLVSIKTFLEALSDAEASKHGS